MLNGQMKRVGPWLELEWPDQDSALEAAQEIPKPRAGSHPHAVRQWLLACSSFPPKWINRLFSVGGIRWQDDNLQLLAFPALDPKFDPLYRKAAAYSLEAIPDILYEDHFCVVFHKPAGMPVHESHPEQTGTLDLAAAKHMLMLEDPLTIRHIHRLDDDTSGPVLYAKNDLAQWKLDEAMRAKDIDRHYIAVVHGRITQLSGTIDEPIGKDRHHRSRRRVTSGGERAITHYEVLSANSQKTIVKVKLETGRTHQIRVHMSHIGHPLLGDLMYGGDSLVLPHQALHGERLLFPHPWSGHTVEAIAPWPTWLKELAQSIDTRLN